jgi:hypothetical protein
MEEGGGRLGEEPEEEEEEGTGVISLGIEERNRGESLILKKFVSRVSIFWRGHELSVKSREAIELDVKFLVDGRRQGGSSSPPPPSLGLGAE